MPAASSDFRLYHGNDLEILAGVLASELAKPMPGTALLAPDTILIPQPAMRRWLQKTLAETHGVAANLRFLTPGEFVREALDANLPGRGDPGLADAAALRWRLWALLADEATMAAQVFAPLAPLLAGPERMQAAWSLAGELAQAFEKYQAWRRDWLLRWDDGGDRGDWQAELWRRVAHGQGHRARRIQDYLQHFEGEAAGVPAGLPPRLFAFACQNVSPDVLRIIASAARAGILHFFFVSPVQGWWGDLQTVRERMKGAADGFFDDDRENPLLRANGAAGRDFVNLLFASELVQPNWELAKYEGPDPEKRTGLLHALQRDLLERHASPVSPTRDFDPGDRSLQLHACHTPLREVQVLHDQLRALLEADASLQPRDIAVLAPDLATYAPMVQAVFGAALNTPRGIPYALSEGGVLATQPLAAWFLRLLSLPLSRFTLPEVLGLLSLPAVAQRLELPAEDLSRLSEWLVEAGARWARDEAHRAALGAPPEQAFTWRWALDRLLLGHARGDEAEVVGMVPLPRLEGGDLVAFDALLRGLDLLERLARALAEPATALQWQARLSAALEALLPAVPADLDDRQALDALRAFIARFGQELQRAGLDAPLPAAVVRDWFLEALSEPDSRQPLLSGGISFGRMVPMRLIPFRVICLLGMDDAAYPRRDPPGALNRLAAEIAGPARQVGDRSVREDDRLLFLQLLAAASDVFYASYLGADPRSGEARPPSVLLSELMDAAAAHARGAKERLVLRHPLQPFSASAFGAKLDENECDEDALRRRSFASEWRPAAGAEASDDARAALPRFAPTELARRNDAAIEVDFAELQRALANPPRYYLRHRLGLRLPRDEDPLPESEPFDRNDHRLRNALDRRVFASLRAGHNDVEALHSRLLAEARVAPGAVGRDEVAAAVARLSAVAASARDWAPDPARRQSFRITLPDGRWLVGTLDDVHAPGLLQFRPGQPSGKHLLAMGLDWLAWGAMGEQRPVRRLLPGLEAADFEPPPPDVALRRLQEMVGLMDRAGTAPLPVLPRSAWTWLDKSLSPKPESAQGAARAAWCGSQHARAYPGEGEDPAVRLALRGQDPFFDDDADAMASFRDLAKQLFTDLPGAKLVTENGDD